MIEQYDDFEIRIGGGQAGDYPVEVDAPAGEASHTFHLPFSDQELDDIMARVQSFDTDRAFLKDVGGKLHRALFAGPVKTLLAESLGMCGEEKGLRLRLRIGPPELAALPWEFLYDGEKEAFLALLPQTLLTRHIAVPEPARSLKARQVRVVVAVASPKNLPPLDVEREKQRLLEALQPLIEQSLAQVEFLEGATMSRLMDKLREKFNILHFIGHGELDEETGQGYLCFEDEWGGTHLIDGETLGHLLADTDIRLVTLNACESARLTSRQARLSMAPALLAAGVPAVVAMQTEIPDETAVIFTREFYRSLAFNRPVGAALTEARNVVQSTLGLENVDWAIPVLYDRSADGHILDLERPKTWQEVWLTPSRLAALAIGLFAFVAILFSAIPGIRQILPVPEPTATPLAFPVAQQNETLVVIARFDQRGTQEFDAAQRIFDHLRSSLQTVTGARPRVEQINEPVADAQAARQLGAVYSATLVIWGWYDDLGITPHYEIVPQAEEVRKIDLGEFIALPSQPDRFVLYVARELPQGMTCLSAFTIGQLYYSQEEWETALDFANLTVENIPDEGMEGLESLYTLRGNTYKWLKEYERAIADFDQALAVNPEDAHAYVGRGSAYWGQREPEAALADLDQAIALDPNIPLAYYNRGLVYFLLGQLDEALPDLDRAIELDPNHANAYLVRGYLYFFLGEESRAFADMDRAVSLVPDSPVGYAGRGGLYIRTDEYEKAEADLRKALELDPDHLEANINLGWLYFRQQRFAEALEFNEKAVVLNPDRPEARFTLAFCLLALGQTERALDENRQAIDVNLFPQTAEEAIADLEWLRQVRPDTPGLDQMLQEIKDSLANLE